MTRRPAAANLRRAAIPATRPAATAHVTLLLANKLRLLTLAAGDNTSPGLEITGDADVLASLVGVLDKPDPGFNIVTP